MHSQGYEGASSEFLMLFHRPVLSSTTMDAMNVLSTAEMQACDRATTERFGVPSLELMRAAAAAVAEMVRTEFPQARQVTVLCGRGNNGGDGMMAARLLSGAGLEVTTLVLGDPEEFEGDVMVAYLELLMTAGGTGPDHPQSPVACRFDCGRDGGHGVQASAERAGTGGGGVGEGTWCARAGGGFALRLACGCD
jgi:hypothetical protein